MTKASYWEGILLVELLSATLTGSSRAQMNVTPYFAAINYPIDKQSLFVCVAPSTIFKTLALTVESICKRALE